MSYINHINRFGIKFLFTGILFITFFNLSAQNTEPEEQGGSGPINIEGFFSDLGPLIEMNLAKPFSPGNRFGIIALGEYSSSWETKKQPENSQYMAQTHLSYHLIKGLDIFAGFFTSSADGVRPTAGIQYIFAKGDFFFLAAPRIDLTQTHNGEIVSFLEYTPHLSGKWNLYTRIAGLYNHSMDTGQHAYSYIRLRAGVSYDIYRFGLGANFTSYGPGKFKEETYGVFLGVWLF